MKISQRHLRRIIKEELLHEETGKSATQLIADFEAAEEKLNSIKDEKKRKETLSKIFVGVSTLAAITYVAPLIAAAAVGAGIKFGVMDFIAKILKSGIVQAWNSISEENRESIINKLPSVTGKAKGLAAEMVGKLLNMPDEKSAQSELLAAIDLPDGLPDMLSDAAYSAALKTIKARLGELAEAGGELKGDSLSLATNKLKKAYGVFPQEPKLVGMNNEGKMKITKRHLRRIIRETMSQYPAKGKDSRGINKAYKEYGVQVGDVVVLIDDPTWYGEIGSIHSAINPGDHPDPRNAPPTLNVVIAQDSPHWDRWKATSTVHADQVTLLSRNKV